MLSFAGKRILFLKIFFIIFCFFDLKNSNSSEYRKIEIKNSLNLNYSYSENHSLNSNFYTEYKLNFYESKNKKWGMFLSGKVNPCYDHFGNEMHVNIFTVLGIDF
jgi:hypothetical protein